ncbi:MAG: Bug family tripartite tricarboxylate transporter substrate binding protein [Hyphomicrobiaceae bacterium]
MKPSFSSASILIASTFTIPQPAAAEDVESFYKDKTVRIVIGYAAGGGADLWGRFMARHLGKFIPGNPNVIVQNMPGAGGFTAVNYVYTNAPKDGTYILLPTSTAISAPTMGIANARWDTFKFQWLGNLTRDVSSCAASGKSGFKSIEESKTKEIIFGADGNDDPASHHPKMMRNLLGYKTKVIAGFKGTGPAFLALERGEIDARCSVWASLALTSKKEDFQTGKLVTIVQVGTTKHPAFGDAPLILDLARNEQQRKVMRFVVGPLEISRPFAVPPGVPADRVAALREAVWKAANSDSLKAEARKLNLIIDPMNAADTEAALRSAVEVPKDVVEQAKAAIND